MDLQERILEWNRQRNGLAFDPRLEIKMLTEELNEFLQATDLAHILAEAADFKFVWAGTVSKYYSQKHENDTMFWVGLDRWKALDQWVEEAFKMILDRTKDVFGISPVDTHNLILKALEIVTTCNELKPTTKDENGKVVKGENHQDPVELIRDMLVSEGILPHPNID